MVIQAGHRAFDPQCVRGSSRGQLFDQLLIPYNPSGSSLFTVVFRKADDSAGFAKDDKASIANVIWSLFDP